MKTLSAALEAHLASGVTTLAWCWRVTRRDGEVLGFTDHDLMLSFDGTDFEPQAGLIPSELRASSDLAVDAQDAEGVLTSDRITETDILDGRWDNAEVEVWRVNWQDTSERVLLRKGVTGEITRGRVAFITEVRSMAHTLNAPTGRSFQGICDAELGDARCTVNLETGTFKGTGAVAELLRDRAFSASGLTAFDDSWFAFGTLEWTTGANAGRRAEVMRHTKAAGVVTLSLLDRPVRAIQAGDAFVIRAGCDKQCPTCADKFSNVDNFRGFPHIPGNDAVVRYARRSGANTGDPL